MIKLKKNKKQTAQQNNRDVLKETLLNNESPELSLTEKLKEKKALKKKKLIKKTSIYSFFGLLGFLVYWGFMPFQGTLPYALCKVILEQNLTFPNTLKMVEVSELRTGAIRLWFTHTDAFGAYRMESFICTYSNDPETGRSKLAQAKWGNVDIDQKQIDNFNKVLPFLVQGEYYDLSLPQYLPDGLEELKPDTNKYRKIKIMDLVNKKK